MEQQGTPGARAGLGVANSRGEIGEGVAVVEIRRVHDVSGSAESIGEYYAPTRQALRVSPSR